MHPIRSKRKPPNGRARTIGEWSHGGCSRARDWTTRDAHYFPSTERARYILRGSVLRLFKFKRAALRISRGDSRSEGAFCGARFREVRRKHHVALQET